MFSWYVALIIIIIIIISVTIHTAKVSHNLKVPYHHCHKDCSVEPQTEFHTKRVCALLSTMHTKLPDVKLQ